MRDLDHAHLVDGLLIAIQPRVFNRPLSIIAPGFATIAVLLVAVQPSQSDSQVHVDPPTIDDLFNACDRFFECQQEERECLARGEPNCLERWDDCVQPYFDWSTGRQEEVGWVTDPHSDLPGESLIVICSFLWGCYTDVEKSLPLCLDLAQNMYRNCVDRIGLDPGVTLATCQARRDEAIADCNEEAQDEWEECVSDVADGRTFD